MKEKFRLKIKDLYLFGVSFIKSHQKIRVADLLKNPVKIIFSFYKKTRKVLSSLFEIEQAILPPIEWDRDLRQNKCQRRQLRDKKQGMIGIET